MPRPLGHKLSEETKKKMRKPHRFLTEAEKKQKSDANLLYHEAKRKWIIHYIETKHIDFTE
jgi:transposase